MLKKIANRFKVVWKELFEEITVFEYVLFWVVRLMLLSAVIFAKSPAYALLDSINMLAAYAMSVLRLIAPRKSFIARLSFRCQHLINIMEIFGTFFGHLLNAYSYISKYDRVLHLVSGPIIVIAGYYIYKAFESVDGKNPKIRPSTAAFTATSFSFVVIVCWEIQEFVSDFYLGSQNQGYWYAPAQDDIWFKIFGYGAQGGEGQFPLWDTMMDMIDATLTTFIAGILLYYALKVFQKRREKKEMLKESETEKTVITA